ncbi:hypothetical protein CC2G_003350 [Coprinopsis cinerea AmutBmut pab1-1]|nr:hypothetical protein CC2G_003350 [Coprinopsis cinerea AmutBmut pab1-1]
MSYERTPAMPSRINPLTLQQSFPSLQKIKYSGSFGEMRTILGRLPSHGVTSISFECVYASRQYDSIEDDEDQWPYLLQLIERKFRTSCTQLSFQSPRTRHPNLNVLSMGIGQLRFLLTALPNITHLDLGSIPCVGLTNHDVECIADTWPNLVALTLSSFYEDVNGDTSLACLLPLATRCPHLKTLAIAVHTAVPIPEYPLDPSSLIFNSKLETLTIAAKDAERPDQVAAYLRMFFPRLVRVWRWRGVYDGKKAGMGTFWEMVNRSLAGLAV